MFLQIEDGQERAFKITFKGFKYPVGFERDGNKLWLTFAYNKPLMEEFKKCFSGMKWHGYDKPVGIKKWSIDYSEHNVWQIGYLSGFNPYGRYDAPLIPHTTTRPLKEHQTEMVQFGLTRMWCILAAEMGLGKSLTVIEIFETVKAVANLNVFWVSKSSALYSAKLEYKLWGGTANVTFMTYEGLKKYISEISPGTLPPKMVIFDEMQALKNQVSQRSQAAAHLTKSMREYYGNDCYIIGMSGSPAPKSPMDWYSLCEIICPGYLREGNVHAFKDRLGVVAQKENAITGGVYPELVGWRDNETNCNECGMPETHNNHIIGLSDDAHKYVKGKNEVSYLYERMKGLVLVKLKKDCLDLPAKIYRPIHCKPSPSIINAMKLIVKTSKSAIVALTRLRELSDGFQYIEGIGEEVECTVCKGHGSIQQPVYIGPDKTYEFLTSLGIYINEGIDLEDVLIDVVQHPTLFEEQPVMCPRCDGTGLIETKTREVKQVSTGKDKALVDLLEEFEDTTGRIVIYAGFTASIDRCVEICIKQKWEVIRVDGRGWHSVIPGKPEELINVFQKGQEAHPKVAFIGHPGSAGTGLTLTASCAIIYFSNDFSAENRIQSQDRIHRIGMNETRGATIIDILHLSTDQYVLDNLEKKLKLQSLSLGEVFKAVETTTKVEYQYG